MSDIALGTLRALSHLILTKVLWGKYGDMEMEAQNGEINCHGHIGSVTLRGRWSIHIIQKEKKV